jgi:hypothetical protein
MKLPKTPFVRAPSAYVLIATLLASALACAQGTPNLPVTGSTPLPEYLTSDGKPFPAPKWVNDSSFPSMLLVGTDKFGDYYSAVSKLSFTFNGAGQLSLDRAGQEELVLPLHDVETKQRQYDCTKNGGGSNQSTTWFPDTAILIRGGVLSAIRPAGGAAMPIFSLSPVEDGLLQFVGEGARGTAVEMAYVPCVSGERVSAGYRTAGFIPTGFRSTEFTSAGTAIDISLPSGEKLTLALSALPLPYIVRRYTGRPADETTKRQPMRLVLATVDVPTKRVVLQFQATFPLKVLPPTVEWRAYLSDAAPPEGVSAARYARRVAEVARELAACQAPTSPVEYC